MMRETMAKVETAFETIKNHLDAGEFDVYGICAIPRGYKVAVGDVLPESYVWEDGTMTDEPLKGTSAVHIADESDSAIKKALRRVGAKKGAYSGYSGNKIALVAGTEGFGGEEIGEVIIPDAKVLAIWPWKGVGHEID